VLLHGRLQDRRFPSIETPSPGIGRALSVDERLLPAGLSHDAAAAAPWLTRRSVAGPLAGRMSLAAAAVDKTSSPGDGDTRCCSCRLCRDAVRRLRVNMNERLRTDDEHGTGRGSSNNDCIALRLLILRGLGP